MTSYSDLLDLGGRTALITGASRGIGAESARALASCGAAVRLVGRDGDALEAVAASCPGAQALILDVTDPEAVKAAMQALRRQDGRLDVLVNNAGIMQGGTVATTSDASVDAMLAVNVAGAFRMARYAARLMAGPRSGSIVNMASVMGVQGAAGYSAYSATKAAVIGMTHALARELAPIGIRVNALAPGFIETEMTSGIAGASRDRALAQIAAGRFGTPADVARAVLFLASPMSEYVTGQVIGVDGSMTC
jgi:3-oxoacyl-[acyl-carrier protein] reductase